MGIQDITIHPRVFKRHPDMTSTDIKHAWTYRVAAQNRYNTDPMVMVVVGYATDGTLLELCATWELDTWQIFHAMRATTKTLKEVGIQTRRR